MVVGDLTAVLTDVVGGPMARTPFLMAIRAGADTRMPPGTCDGAAGIVE